MRHTYGLGYTLSTTGDDPNNTFNQFLVAYGGGGIVTPDGQLHTKDAKVRKAVIKALTGADRSLQGRLCAAERVELGRSGQQQCIPRQGGRDVAERYDLDLRRRHGQQEGILRRDHELSAATGQCGQGGPGAAWR